jgi:hypothetical protein
MKDHLDLYRQCCWWAFTRYICSAATSTGSSYSYLSHAVWCIVSLCRPLSLQYLSSSPVFSSSHVSDICFLFFRYLSFSSVHCLSHTIKCRPFPCNIPCPCQLSVTVINAESSHVSILSSLLLTIFSELIVV